MDLKMIVEMHYTEKLDCVEIAKRCNTEKRKIHKLLKSNGYKIQNHRTVNLDVDIIQNLHHIKKLTIQEISKKFKCSFNAVKSFMSKNDIEYMKHHLISLDKDYLILHHHEKKSTLTSISKQLNVSIDSVKANMIEYGIEIRHYHSKTHNINPDDIVKLHIHDKLSLTEISNRYNCDKTVITKICKSNGIDIHRYQISSQHRKIKELLDSYGIVYVDNTRTIIPPLELDIYIPELKLAIELNGIYWHSEKFKPKNYHREKYIMCNGIGIQLIQIWEDDFNLNADKILKFIQYKLGFNEGRVFARKCKIIEVPNCIAGDFHVTNHIQGKCPTSFSIGLEYEHTIVAVCSFKRTKNTLDLVRYSTDINVVGGFTKILSYVDKTVTFDKIITFADLCISNGNLYDISGFTVDKIIPPDYKYLVNGVRKHKFGYRLKRFRNDTKLLYQTNLTEHSLAKLNGLLRVYDAGKIKYVLRKS